MPGDNSSRKKFISGKFIIKVLVTLALVGLICWHIDFRDFVRDLKLISTKTVIISSLLYTIGQIVSAVKWKIFLKRAGISRSFFALNHAYFLGMFINTFGLGTVGGDIA